NNISVANLPAGLTSSKNGLTLTISGTPTASGTYTVTATNASGATKTATGTITVNPAPTTGVEDAEKAEWTVTNDEVLYSADVQKITVYDFVGRNVLGGTASSLNISALPAGNYVAVAIANGNVATLKFNKK
ncbi:MAG: T9SS type A sorting domain-containing protein, partial [Paludibacteraceae bacterium]|nr:T9SS type A sorting domain-containing protein [Paludibacteraceae bacterium]